MQDNARKITYGAMMIALFAILLAVSLYVPLLGSIIMFLSLCRLFCTDYAMTVHHPF